jgi:hypothetical protein
MDGRGDPGRSEAHEEGSSNGKAKGENEAMRKSIRGVGDASGGEGGKGGKVMQSEAKEAIQNKMGRCNMWERHHCRPEAAAGARSRMRPEGWERRRQPNTHPEHHGKQKEEEAVAWGRKRGGR